MIYIMDEAASKVLGVLANQPSGKKALWNDTHKETLQGELSLDFQCAADIAVAENIVTEKTCLWKDDDGSKRLARMKVVTQQVGEDGRYVKMVHAEGIHGDLNDVLIEGDISFVGETAESIIAVLVAGTDWSVGTIEYSGLLDMPFSMGDTVLAAVRAVIAASGLEWRFRVEFDDSTVTGRFIDGMTRIGRFTGERFLVGRNVKSLTHTTDSSEIATRVLAVGGTDADGKRVTVANAVWSVAGGDPVDKPEGDLTVEDPDATARYGRTITRLFEDTNETSPSKLLEKAWAWLQTVEDPRTSIDMDAPLPQGSNRRLGLGDSIVVDVPKFRPPLLGEETRINDIDRSYSDPTGSGFAAQKGVF